MNDLINKPELKLDGLDKAPGSDGPGSDLQGGPSCIAEAPIQDVIVHAQDKKEQMRRIG